MHSQIQKREISLSDGVTEASPILVELSGDQSCVVVNVGKGVRATFFDTSSSRTHRVDLTVGAESTVTYISLSSLSARTLLSTVAEAASLHWHCTTIGNAESDHSLVSTCTGPNAKSDIDWIFTASENERQSMTVRNIFAARNGGGEITLKGVAQHKAHAVCNGMIEITEQGTGTDTYLTEDVLMLDPTAKIDAVPGLEIRTNDVKASHSATVSRVTVEDLFYFQSRGIAPAVARAMYVDGFLSDLTDSVEDLSIRKRLVQALSMLSVA